MIVDNAARLCAMNLLLHDIESSDSDSPVHVDDALSADPGERFDMVLTNPPFGKKSSVTSLTDGGKSAAPEHRFTYDELVARTKSASTSSGSATRASRTPTTLPPSGVIAAELVEDLQAAVAELTELAEWLQGIGVDIEDADGWTRTSAL